MFFRQTLALIVFTNELWWTAFRHLVLQVPVKDNLPLHLCDFSVFVLLIGLLRPTPFIAELAYFIGIPGALLAMLFPAIDEEGAFRMLAYTRFYLTHGAIMLTGFYLTFGRGYAPPFRGVVRAFIVLHAYALFLVPINLFLGTNYLYLMAPASSAPAWLKVLPHWAYLGSFSLFFFVVFVLMWLPLFQATNQKNHR